MTRCTGHCCQRFFMDLDSLTCPEKSVLDGDYIRDMAMLLEVNDNGDHWFTCRHFNGQDCTAYEERPAMCRDYPYGKKCNYEGCTMASSPPDPREAPHTPPTPS